MNRSSLVTLGLAILILASGLFAVLIVQPAPPAYAEGWSDVSPVSEASADAPPRLAIDRRDRSVCIKDGVFHLEAELPGVDPDKLDVRMDDGMLFSIG